MKIVWALLYIYFFLLSQAYGAYFQTLPKGRRMLIFREVTTDKVVDNFNSTGSLNSYSIKQNILAKDLEDTNEIVNLALKGIKEASPHAYDIYSLGQWEVDIDAKVNVSVFGAAYGITDKLTFYAWAPYYRAKVNVNPKQIKGSNSEEVTKLLKNSSPETQGPFLSQFPNQLPEADIGLLQSVVVNYLGYQPIGNWEGKDFGDVEMGFMHRLTDWRKGGLKTAFGVVLANGRVDDPDIIQDISFGDGAWDLFLEFGGTYDFHSNIYFDSFVRGSYQNEQTQRLRIRKSESFPLSEESGIFNYKLGNKLLYSFSTGFRVNEWFTIIPEYNYFYEEAGDFSSPYQLTNQIMAKNSEKEFHLAKISLEFSTLGMYFSNKFPVPFNITLGGQRYLSGLNSPKYTRFDLDLRMYF